VIGPPADMRRRQSNESDHPFAAQDDGEDHASSSSQASRVITNMSHHEGSN
jgi:hypothetical protein